MKSSKPKVIVICGPTASGKTKLSIELAKKIEAEIVSADSMQIYKDMNIGTAKPTIEEMQGIKHYMIGNISPQERFSVASYKIDAEQAIEEILLKGKTPIVVGGTGLYIDSLIYDINFADIKIDEQYRKELEKISNEQGLDKLYKMAVEIDAQAMEKISKNDKKRIIRVLEIYKQTNKTKTEHDILSRQKEVKYDHKVFAINIPRDILYNRINERVDSMINSGLIDEVKNLLRKYNNFPTAMQGLGYKEVKKYLEGELTRQEMIDKLKLETRRYAKRQLTWFRKNNRTIWLNGTEDTANNVEIIISYLGGYNEQQ